MGGGGREGRRGAAIPPSVVPGFDCGDPKSRCWPGIVWLAAFLLGAPARPLLGPAFVDGGAHVGVRDTEAAGVARHY